MITLHWLATSFGIGEGYSQRIRIKKSWTTVMVLCTVLPPDVSIGSSTRLHFPQEVTKIPCAMRVDRLGSRTEISLTRLQLKGLRRPFKTRDTEKDRFDTNSIRTWLVPGDRWSSRGSVDPTELPRLITFRIEFTFIQVSHQDEIFFVSSKKKKKNHFKKKTGEKWLYEITKISHRTNFLQCSEFHKITFIVFSNYIMTDFVKSLNGTVYCSSSLHLTRGPD